jgi:membrane protease subunit HflK
MRLLARLLVPLLLLGAGAAWFASGWFEVAPDEEAVVLRLGRHVRTAGPGLHWHARLLERVETRAVTATLQEEFGYRTLDPGPPPRYEDKPDEKLMLSGDANLVNVEFVVQYRIADLGDYLFRVAEPAAVIRDVGESAMREVVGQRPIDDVLEATKGPIEAEARERMQQSLDAYGAGVEVLAVRLQDVIPPDEVREAFADVAGATQDRERAILDAQGYADQLLPVARGEASEQTAQARGYKETRVRTAQGEAARFTALLVEYERAPAVTRERLWLETVEAILPGMEKVILEEGGAAQVLPYLPLGRPERKP